MRLRRQCLERRERPAGDHLLWQRGARAPAAQAVEARFGRVVVAADRCQGHNRCKLIAPNLFDLDEFGQARVAGDGQVPSDLEEKARLAVANCPEYAIKIVQV